MLLCYCWCCCCFYCCNYCTARAIAIFSLLFSISCSCSSKCCSCMLWTDRPLLSPLPSWAVVNLFSRKSFLQLLFGWLCFFLSLFHYCFFLFYSIPYIYYLYIYIYICTRVWCMCACICVLFAYLLFRVWCDLKWTKCKTRGALPGSIELNH